MHRHWLQETIEVLRRTLMAVGLLLFVGFGIEATSHASSWQEVTGQPRVFPLPIGPAGLQAGLQSARADAVPLAAYAVQPTAPASQTETPKEAGASTQSPPHPSLSHALYDNYDTEALIRTYASAYNPHAAQHAHHHARAVK